MLNSAINRIHGSIVLEQTPREIAHLGISLARYVLEHDDVWLEYGFQWTDDKKNYWIFIDNFGLRSSNEAGRSYSKNLINAFPEYSKETQEIIFSPSIQNPLRRQISTAETIKIKENIESYFTIENLYEKTNGQGIFAFLIERYQHNGILFGDNWISKKTLLTRFNDLLKIFTLFHTQHRS